MYTQRWNCYFFKSFGLSRNFGYRLGFYISNTKLFFLTFINPTLFDGWIGRTMMDWKYTFILTLTKSRCHFKDMSYEIMLSYMPSCQNVCYVGVLRWLQNPPLFSLAAARLLLLQNGFVYSCLNFLRTLAVK